ncbi:MAG: DUF3015 family protein [Bdellovibrionaceae bacterium]|nr:DUF3015 family protein [Pseudobdellovibrionaceae bacterium]
MTKDASRGEGESLNGLAHIMKCSDQGAFNRGVQSNFEKIFMESSNAYNNIRSIYDVINSDPSLKSSCNVAG